jgi:hypothetical protein
MTHWLQKQGWTEAASTQFIEFLLEKALLQPLVGISTIYNSSAKYEWINSSLDSTGNIGGTNVQSEANRAAFKLYHAATENDALKLKLESIMQHFLLAAEEKIAQFVHLIRDALKHLLDVEKCIFGDIDALCDRMNVVLLMLDSQKEIQRIGEHHKTGIKPVKTYVPPRLLKEYNGFLVGHFNSDIWSALGTTLSRNKVSGASFCEVLLRSN